MVPVAVVLLSLPKSGHIQDRRDHNSHAGGQSITPLFSLRAPLLQLSATQIRQFIREGKSIRYMVPEKVREEIERGRYYKK